MFGAGGAATFMFWAGGTAKFIFRAGGSARYWAGEAATFGTEATFTVGAISLEHREKFIVVIHTLLP
jgi:hypothetical protein